MAAVVQVGAVQTPRRRRDAVDVIDEGEQVCDRRETVPVNVARLGGKMSSLRAAERDGRDGAWREGAYKVQRVRAVALVCDMGHAVGLDAAVFRFAD